MRWYQNRRLTRSMSKGTPQAVRVVQGILPRLGAAVGSAVIVAILVAPVDSILMMAFTVNGTWTTQILPPVYTLHNLEILFTNLRILRQLLVFYMIFNIAHIYYH